MGDTTKTSAPPELIAWEKKGRVIRSALRTAASPEQVWEAWTDPVKIAQWFTDAASGAPVVGSTYIWEFHKFGYKIPYTVLEAEPGRRFSIGWSMPARDPGILEITITRDGGDTVVTLVNSGFRDGAEWDDEYEGVASGWEMSLHILKEYLERHFGRPKTQVLSIRPASFEYDRLRPFFLDERLLASWLTTAGGLTHAGERYTLELRDFGTASGRVLAITPREVALSWDEIGGVLELKAFSMGPAGRAVGLRALTWHDLQREAQLQQWADGAVGRLVGAIA